MEELSRVNLNDGEDKSVDRLSKQLVTFLLGKSEYAIDIMKASSIIKMEKITIIPNTPDFIEGVINLRGNVIPIIDLKKRFSLEESEGISNTSIIIVKVKDIEMGIVIDSVSKVTSILEDDIQPPPPVFSGIGQKYIEGVGRIDGALLIILDLERLLSINEQDTLKEM